MYGTSKEQVVSWLFNRIISNIFQSKYGLIEPFIRSCFFRL